VAFGHKFGLMFPLGDFPLSTINLDLLFPFAQKKMIGSYMHKEIL
jgi:hypothetical protein